MRIPAVMVAIGAVLIAQGPAPTQPDRSSVTEFAGVYQWAPDAYLYLQHWTEFGGAGQLGAFDESGEIRALYADGRDRFTTGPGMAVPKPTESRVTLLRDATGSIDGLTWEREGSPARTAKRVAIERHEEVRFSNGSVQLAGTLIAPATTGKHAAIVLVHASGPQNRESILPFARVLVRRGVAVLGYDKRGVGGSSGDWTIASFDDLAGDAVAAVDYLKTRTDIDASRIGLLGVSQAGWILPLAAVRSKDLAFVVSVSGAGVPAAETTIDQAQNEMPARGMRPDVVNEIVAIMKLQNNFARTGSGWDEYLAARARLAGRIGNPPEDTFPSSREHAYWQTMRRLYFYDPAPTLRQLRTPVLALFGELDNNILADKNSRAWASALKAGGHRDFTLRTLPKANHYLMQATIGSNAEMPTLQRFVPEYYPLLTDWLAKRIDRK